MTSHRRLAGRAALAIAALCAGAARPSPQPPARRAPYPASTYVTGIDFDMATLRNVDADGQSAPGSDNWAITWAADGHQYAAWGDGGGFGGDNERGRVTLGVARIEGDRRAYRARNVWGGHRAEHPAEFGGKSYGIASVDGALYLWRTGTTTDSSMFTLQELRRSTDRGATWQPTGVAFRPPDFGGEYSGFYAPTFLQFGRDYRGARDGYVYAYAPERRVSVDTASVWDVQRPGHITLFRVPRARIGDRGAYEFFAGADAAGAPRWTADVRERRPAFADSANGVMRTSVSYNPGLRRYLLFTQHVSRYKHLDGHVGIYEAPEPWGPWRTVLFANAWTIEGKGRLYENLPLRNQPSAKTVYLNFANKWLSADGRRFVVVYTGPGSDEWGTVEGAFRVAPAARAARRAAAP